MQWLLKLAPGETNPNWAIIELQGSIEAPAQASLQTMQLGLFTGASEVRTHPRAWDRAPGRS